VVPAIVLRKVVPNPPEGRHEPRLASIASIHKVIFTYKGSMDGLCECLIESYIYKLVWSFRYSYLQEQ
jgi:hypothetical protein